MRLTRRAAAVALVVLLFEAALLVVPIGKTKPPLYEWVHRGDSVVCPVGTMVVPADWGATAQPQQAGC